MSEPAAALAGAGVESEAATSAFWDLGLNSGMGSRLGFPAPVAALPSVPAALRLRSAAIVLQIQFVVL